MTPSRTTALVNCAVVRALWAGLVLFLLQLGLWAGGIASPSQAQAQTTLQAPPPSITLIVPFPEGGPTDTLGRLLAKYLGERLSTPVLIQNIAGAGGTLGTLRAAQATPDGRTLLFNHIGQATAPALYRRLRHNALTDFEPIGLVAEVPMTLVARPSFNPNNIAELMQHLKHAPYPVRYAHGGVGSASYLCGMLLQEALRTNFELHAYKGTGPALQGLMQGNTDLLCDQTTNTTEAILERKVKAYAVSTRTQLAALPWLPTLHASGLNGFEMTVWHGVYAPRDTQRNIVEHLSQALKEVLQNPSFLLDLEQLGVSAVEPERANPEALRTHLELEIERWAVLVHQNQRHAH